MGLAGGESVWSDPSWLDEPSPETPWLANERYATVATRMEFQRSKRLFSRLARCLPACRKRDAFGKSPRQLTTARLKSNLGS